MKIYAKFENTGSEYDTYTPVAISLKPFKNDCWVTELTDQNILSIFNEEAIDCDKFKFGKWKPYNVILAVPCWCNPKNKDYTTDGYRCTKYIEGNIDKEYFSENEPKWLRIK